MFRDDPAYAEKARRVSEHREGHHRVPGELELMRAGARDGSRASPITRPARCSTASRSASEPKKLLKQAGFTVKDVPEGHICCGSAGTYNLLQPEIAGAAARPQGRQHRARPSPTSIATGNIGCITQIGQRHRRSRSSTRSSCSTGRPAGRCRGSWRMPGLRDA